MAYTVTAASLVETDLGILYVGPLEEAIRFVEQDGGYTERKLDNGMWEAYFQNGDKWGRGFTLEMAQRFALGECFGPVDDEFRPILLATPEDVDRALDLLSEAPRIYQLLAEAEVQEGDWRYCLQLAKEKVGAYVATE